MEFPQKLIQIEEQLRAGGNGELITPRELLGWFGYYRRTWRHVNMVKSALKHCGLVTFPDFEGTGIDEPIVLTLKSAGNSGTDGSAPTDQTTTTTTVDPNIAAVQPAVVTADSEVPTTHSQAPADPVHRVGRFLPKSMPISVARDESVDVAITQMLLHDFSQLPVMQGDRSVAGLISWHSIGQRRAMGNTPQYVRDCLETHYEVKADDSIFDAIRVIQEHECVLVRSSENRIVGILTATDISGSFEQLSRPFLLLSYVENHLRALIHSKFDVAELQSAKDPSDTDRQINDVSDMTFGEYIRLLENPVNWSKLGIGIERSLLISQLNEVREIRNDVMHFNPEGIEEKDMGTLKRFNSFLQSMVSVLQKS